MTYALVRRAAWRRFLHIQDGALSVRSEILGLHLEERLAPLDKIRTLDYGAQGNLGARGLLVGYVSPDPSIVWTLLPGLTEEETMRVIELMRADFPQPMRSGLVCGALYERPSMLSPNAPYVVRPGIPLPAGFKPHPGRSYSD